jgi:hypothetical protein
MRFNHIWRYKSTHQQICSRCGQVRRWNGTRWLYRKLGLLVRERPNCGDKRTDSDRYAELRKLVEDWLEAMDPASPVVMFDNALRLVLDWRHR